MGALTTGERAVWARARARGERRVTGSVLNVERPSDDVCGLLALRLWS